MDEVSASKQYQHGKNLFFLINLILDVLFLIFVFFSGLSFYWRDAALKVFPQLLATNSIYIFFFSVCLYVWHFPLTIFAGYTWEHKFGLSNQNLKEWLRDDVKKGLIGFVIMLMMVNAVYLFLSFWPRFWWIAAGIFYILLSGVLARLMPNIIIPLFYKYAPIANEELKNSIKKLFEACRLPLRDVCSINLSSKTKKANAFVCGIGQNRRVVLSDTLLNHFSVGEIETVVAHELAHYKNRDIIKLIILNAFVVFCGLLAVDRFLRYAFHHYFAGRVEDIAYFPIVALAMMIFLFLATPLMNAYSRTLERQVDEFSLRITKKQNHFVSMMQKLGALNLAEVDPSKWVELFLYDHPSIKRRIEFAQQFKADEEK